MVRAQPRQPDFIFESKKLIIELDGTQHKKTVEQDAIRDKWFLTKGYNVVRITIDEFKKKIFFRKRIFRLTGTLKGIGIPLSLRTKGFSVRLRGVPPICSVRVRVPPAAPKNFIC